MLGLFKTHDQPTGRDTPMEITAPHVITGHPITPPFPAHLETATFGMGCFWGAERRFWQQRGVHITAVGYAGGETSNPTYKEVCTGLTGHAEVVLVVFDPDILSYGELLTLFWNSHDPTQGMRQGNDIGSQYRSVLYTHNEQQQAAAVASRDEYNKLLGTAGFGTITTEIAPTAHFYYAEPYHQQYLAKNPDGYCGLRGTGIVYQGQRP
jgi:peptide-methionine (S)-S-oxide reductase